MSAAPARSSSRCRSSSTAGSSTALRLLALFSANATLVPPSRWERGAGRAAAGRFDLENLGAEVGQDAADRVALTGRQVEHPQRRK